MIYFILMPLVIELAETEGVTIVPDSCRIPGGFLIYGKHEVHIFIGIPCVSCSVIGYSIAENHDYFIFTIGEILCEVFLGSIPPFEGFLE